jgi:hypothetical protein
VPTAARPAPLRAHLARPSPIPPSILPAGPLPPARRFRRPRECSPAAPRPPGRRPARHARLPLWRSAAFSAAIGFDSLGGGCSPAVDFSSRVKRLMLSRTVGRCACSSAPPQRRAERFSLSATVDARLRHCVSLFLRALLQERNDDVRKLSQKKDSRGADRGISG